MFEDIRGKRVLVTGASSGIGACTAELFARHGAVVGIHYHTGEASARGLQERIRRTGGDAILLEADLLDPPSRENLVPGFIGKAGGIDVLVNSAGGILGPAHFLDLDQPSWEATLHLNLTAPYILAREAFRWMKEHGGGTDRQHRLHRRPLRGVRDGHPLRGGEGRARGRDKDPRKGRSNA